MSDDYLFDPDAKPDPEIVRLEQALAPFRHRRTSAKPARRAPWRWIALTAAAAALCVAGFWWMNIGSDSSGTSDSSGSTSTASGARKGFRLQDGVDSARVFAADGRLRAAGEAIVAGDRIVLDDKSRARLGVGSIGSVVLEENTEVRVDARPDDGETETFGLFLERGTVAASIFAAPRVFQVGTPSGIAVDLGCIYTTTVTDDGRTLLAVVSGFVSFEAEPRKVFVPTGAECEALPGVGPLTPTWKDAAPEFKAAIRRLDVEATPPPEALVALAESPTDDRATLTLWHLLSHAQFAVKKAALDALVTANRVPAGISTQALMDGDEAALTTLRKSFHWSW